MSTKLSNSQNSGCGDLKHSASDTENSLPALINERIIRNRILPISRRTLQRYISAGKFPRPDLRLGVRNFWRRETVLQWVQQQ